MKKIAFVLGIILLMGVLISCKGDGVFKMTVDHKYINDFKDYIICVITDNDNQMSFAVTEEQYRTIEPGDVITCDKDGQITIEKGETK